MKISSITTVLNEKNSVARLIESLTTQTLLPDEIVIVDGGSTDGTFEELQRLAAEQYPGTKIIILQKIGNRSVGRNEAIRQATGEIITCTDAGSFPEKHWVAEITKPFSDPTVDVVAGYYEAKTETIFQECLVPYVFVMPDKIRMSTFLPASRSMAFKKSIWEKAGMFPEDYSHNEDYVFAHTLKNMGAKIHFRKEAIVYWTPRKTFREAYTMFFRFAYGDAEAGIHRPKVSLLFARYIIGIALFLTAVLTQSLWLFLLCFLLLTGYVVWAIAKSYRYVDEAPALYFFPALQFTSDAAVLFGTMKGWMSRTWGTKKTS